MSDIVFSALLNMGIFVILAISLNLINGFTGMFSLGHAAFFGIGAYSASLYMNWVSPEVYSALYWSHFIAGSLLAVTVAAFLGLLVGVPCLRLTGDYLAIATLAFFAGTGLGVLVGDASPARDTATLDLPPLVIKDPFRDHRRNAHPRPRAMPDPARDSRVVNPFDETRPRLADLPTIRLKDPFAEISPALRNLPEVYLKDPFGPSIKNPFGD